MYINVLFIDSLEKSLITRGGHHIDPATTQWPPRESIDHVDLVAMCWSPRGYDNHA
jgi:hypothetical protein